MEVYLNGSLNELGKNCRELELFVYIDQKKRNVDDKIQSSLAWVAAK